MATATFWRIFHHDGKISPGQKGWECMPNPFHLIYRHIKVVEYAPVEWADTLPLFLLYLYMYSVVYCTLYSVIGLNSWTKSRQKSSEFSSTSTDCLEISISSNSRNLLQIYTVKLLYTAKNKGGIPYRKPCPFPMF